MSSPAFLFCPFMPETKATTAAMGSPGPRMTRSEAARNASLIRWKKKAASSAPVGGMSPAIQARVKEILAEKAKKKGGGKGKAKAKGGGKGKGVKQTPAQKQAEKDKARAKNVTAIADSTGLGDDLANLDKFKQGGDLDPKAGAALFKQGLVTTNDDGSFRMAPAGHAVLSAAEKGDKGAARDALAAGKDALGRAEDKEQAKGEREKTKQAKEAERTKAKAERVKAAEQKKQERAAAQAKKQHAAKKQKQEKPSASDDAAAARNDMAAAFQAARAKAATKAVRLHLATKEQTDQERAIFAKLGQAGKAGGKRLKGGAATPFSDSVTRPAQRFASPEAADAAMRNGGISAAPRMNTAQKNALGWYQGTGHDTINSTLRGQREPTEQQQWNTDNTTRRLDQVMNRSQLQANVEAHRGMLVDTPESRAMLDKMQPGVTFRDPGYVSTSFSPDVAHRFGPTGSPSDVQASDVQAVNMRVRVPAGTSALYMPTANPKRGVSSGPANEYELLLARNLNYRVASRSESGGRVDIELEVLP